MAFEGNAGGGRTSSGPKTAGAWWSVCECNPYFNTCGASRARPLSGKERESRADWGKWESGYLSSDDHGSNPAQFPVFLDDQHIFHLRLFIFHFSLPAFHDRSHSMANDKSQMENEKWRISLGASSYCIERLRPEKTSGELRNVAPKVARSEKSRNGSSTFGYDYGTAVVEAPMRASERRNGASVEQRENGGQAESNRDVA